ncbi:hydantoinase/oxoprolinase family protein [Amycolatopsis sp. NBC_01307]|uniref:hydantoinase/oxoprolinase family protein n=1 Tax=Amycolatopsis sp. NBC_01307 TaxID=2903561 RepID=UPI002E12F605|nr:hydantoinase/oxoprolinase family protein [Amycolatopsis sp. NBC_01307]
MRIGIDVGRSTTDGVLVDRERVLGAVKLPTSGDHLSVLPAVIRALRAATGFAPDAISAVMLGTRQFLDAVTQARGLVPTAVIRFAVPSPRGLLPLAGWPPELAQALGGKHFVLLGGCTATGGALGPFPTAEFLRALEEIDAAGIGDVALSSAGATVDAGFERRAKQLIEHHLPRLRVTQSHEVGHVGLIGRENATVLNASLRALADRTLTRVSADLAAAGITAPLYVSQNDGTVMDGEHARRFPVATFAAGSANAIRGAGFLSGYQDGVVVDIGNSRTRIGLLRHGYPRTTVDTVRTAGVHTNSRTPDVRILGVGGGSSVRGTGTGLRLTPGVHPLPRVLGGSHLTLTDIAVLAGATQLGDAGRLPGFPGHVAARMLAVARRRIEDTVAAEHTGPLIAVGGAGFLVPDRVDGVAEAVLRPEGFAVAGAVGAAVADVGGHVDRIVGSRGQDVEALTEAACREAAERAIAAGAAIGSITLTDVDVVPLHHLPQEMTRIRVHAVGTPGPGR